MVTFYCTNSSLASQACLTLIKLLNIEVDIEEQELGADDTNAIMKVPVLVDDELVLTEPRAIMVYLAEASDYYSSDKKKRAIINQRLLYDAAVVFPSLMKLIRPIMLERKRQIPSKHKDAFLAVIRVLEGLLVNNDYFANNEISLADISIFPSVMTAIKLGLNLSPFPCLSVWCDRMRAIDDFKELTACTECITSLIKSVTNVF